MTVTVSTNKVTWLGNGATTVFPYAFAMPAGSDGVLYYTTASGVQTTVAPGSYGITGAGQPTAGGGPQGGTLTYPLTGPPIPAGSTLTLLRTVPDIQPNSFTNQGGLWPLVVEASDDNLAFQIQQNAEIMGRAVLFNVADIGPFATLPPAAQRAGQTLSFDGQGNLIVGLPSGSALISLAMQPVVDASSVAIAASALSVTPYLDTIAALRAVTSTSFPSVICDVLGFAAIADGGGGVFRVKASDTTSLDNGGTKIVDASGRIWYRDTGAAHGFNVLWFGAFLDGTDRTAAVQAALNAPSVGGVVFVPAGGSLYCASSITIPVGISFKGPYAGVGIPALAGVSTPFASMASLALGAAATIASLGGSTITGFLILPQGMTFPQASSAGWAGTAITGTGEDIVVERCMIVGFGQAITVNGDRFRAFYNLLDCQSGIFVTNAFDVSKITGNHAWPFATWTPSGLWPPLARSGTAYEISASDDWALFTDNFCFGYQIGYRCLNSDSVSFLNCGADNIGAANTAIGFYVDGASSDTKMIGCRSSAHEIGYYLNSTAGAPYSIRLIGCDAWGIITHGVLIDTANTNDVVIDGGTIRDSNGGVSIENSTCSVSIDNTLFENILTPALAINSLAANSQVHIGKGNNFVFPAGSILTTNLASAVVPVAASNVSLPMRGEVFTISGSGSFGTLGGGWEGRVVTLIVETGLTIFSGVGTVNNMRLAGSASFVAGALAAITLVHNGNQWFETGRAA